MLCHRSRLPGCVSATRAWFSVWSRTLRSPCSSRALWTSGPPGWITWSLRSSNPTRAVPVSPKQLASSCSSGRFTGMKERNTFLYYDLKTKRKLQNVHSSPPCSSMVIRDLTLRSAASFGSFHLIRLLYDEYMFYLVEHRVAQATGETPIAVMGEVRTSARSQENTRITNKSWSP